MTKPKKTPHHFLGYATYVARAALRYHKYLLSWLALVCFGGGIYWVFGPAYSLIAIGAVVLIDLKWSERKPNVDIPSDANEIRKP